MKICGSERDRNQEVGLDQTHPQQASIQHHTPSPDLEPAGEEKKRPASQQLQLRQSRSKKGAIAAEWPEQPRTECDGEGS